jgi:hypothetical protein
VVRLQNLYKPLLTHIYLLKGESTEKCTDYTLLQNTEHLIQHLEHQIADISNTYGPVLPILLPRIWELPGSNLGPQAAYPE